MTPTREQIDAARVYLSYMVRNQSYPPGTCEAITILLAATAEPTEQELAEEAADWIIESECSPETTYVAAYIAGARREGRK